MTLDDRGRSMFQKQNGTGAFLLPKGTGGYGSRSKATISALEPRQVQRSCSFVRRPAYWAEQAVCPENHRCRWVLLGQPAWRQRHFGAESHRSSTSQAQESPTSVARRALAEFQRG